MVTITHKKSATTDDEPTTGQLSLGELAINTYDGKLFTLKEVSGSQSVVEIGEAQDWRPITAGGSSLSAGETLILVPATDMTIAESGGTVTISHSDTSSQSSVNNSGNTFIQDITLDGRGHVTALASVTVSGSDGTVTSVTAGAGMTQTGTSTVNPTLNVIAGTGIDVAADAISVDVSDFMTNGANNYVVTATGTDAMNAEANLTFDGGLLTITDTDSGDPQLKLVGQESDYLRIIGNDEDYIDSRDYARFIIHTQQSCTFEIDGNEKQDRFSIRTDPSNAGTLKEVFVVGNDGEVVIQKGVGQATAVETWGNNDFDSDTALSVINTASGTYTSGAGRAFRLKYDGTITAGTWQGGVIGASYLSGQSGTNTGDTSVTDSVSTSSSSTRASATGVKAAYDRAWATTAQGSTADSAVQPGGALGTPSSGTLTNCTFPTANINTDKATTFFVRDDDDDYKTIAHGKYVKFVSATGTAGTNWSGAGSSGDPWVMTITNPDTTYSVGAGGLTQQNFTTTLKNKLDAVEASADVTDTANVTSSGALMDSECTDLAAVKATEDPFTAALLSKLNAIEASADVTDTSNVTSSGALMDSECASLSAVKAFTGEAAATADQTKSDINA